MCSNKDEKKENDKIPGSLMEKVEIWDGKYEEGYFNNQKRD
ncbi:hypothetical protein [Spiroplasma endosymbiont of Calodromius spilotus]